MCYLKYSVIPALFSLLVTTHGAAQESGRYAEIFDDGGVSEASNAVKLDITSFIQGEYGLTYEGFLNDWFAMEAGVSYIADFFDMGLYTLADPELYADKSTYGGSGYGFFVMPKIYFGSPMNSFYTGLGYRFRDMSDVKSADYLIYLGRHKLISTFLLVDVSAGIGLRTLIPVEDEVSFFNSPDDDMTPMILSFRLSVGYLF